MKSLSQTHVFIVEDNFAYSYIVEAMLKEYGNFKVTTFASGEQCVEMLDNNPDLIILDYNLDRGMNGLETFKAIHLLKPKIPVIILSGQTDVQIAADFLKAGATDYIEKKNKEQAMEQLIISILNALGKKFK
jgi:DNA-binding NtrC family response regulator